MSSIVGIFYIRQDGADFYVYGAASEEAPLLASHTAPYKVRDGDFRAAEESRCWFIAKNSRNARLIWLDEDMNS